MKKSIILVFLIGILALSLCGCATPDVPGTAWAEKEILAYDVLKRTESSAEGVKFAEAVSTLTRVSGTVKLENVGKEYTVSSGSHFSFVTTDLDGKIVMKSEFIMDGFQPVASYKTVDYNGTHYSYAGEYRSSKYVYDFTDYVNPEKSRADASISAKGTFMDNEFLYMYIRCYDVKTINKSISIVSPANAQSETLSVRGGANLKAKMFLPGKSEAEEVTMDRVQISRTAVPVGSSIEVYYTEYDAESDSLNLGIKTNKDYHIPALIVENDVAYKLQSNGDAIQVFHTK